MTKFRNNTGFVSTKEKKVTKFIYDINERDLSLINTHKSPTNYDIVEYLGKQHIYTNGSLDYFRAKDEGANTWAFFLGTKGDEFK